MKYLIVGLGNIGKEYQNTRHNIGFKVLDVLAKQFNLGFSNVRYGSIIELEIKGRILLLLKPSTYMNLSGKAVSYYIMKEKIKKENLFVIVDDLALPFGTIRIKSKGSSGGHNGLQNIEDTLQTQDYIRLRFGIGNEFSKGHQVDYVLGDWTKEEEEKINPIIDQAVDAIKSFPFIGIDRTMNFFNIKK